MVQIKLLLCWRSILVDEVEGLLWSDEDFCAAGRKGGLFFFVFFVFIFRLDTGPWCGKFWLYGNGPGNALVLHWPAAPGVFFSLLEIKSISLSLYGCSCPGEHRDVSFLRGASSGQEMTQPLCRERAAVCLLAAKRL